MGSRFRVTSRVGGGVIVTGKSVVGKARSLGSKYIGKGLVGGLVGGLSSAADGVSVCSSGIKTGVVG